MLVNEGSSRWRSLVARRVRQRREGRVQRMVLVAADQEKRSSFEVPPEGTS